MTPPVYTVEPAWLDEAVDSATKRRQFHAEFGSKRHWFDPKKGEYADEIFGSLAQIGFRERTKAAGIYDLCKFSPLYTPDLNEMPEWDVLLEGRTVDIKAIPPDDEKTKRRRLLVKVSEFKHLDFYVAVKFLTPETFMFSGYATGDEVAARKPADFGFAPAYWFFLDQLPHQLVGKWWRSHDKVQQTLAHPGHVSSD